MSDILTEMEQIDPKESQNDPNKEQDIQSFDLFTEDNKPKVDEKNDDIINKRLDSRFADLDRREKELADKIAKIEKFDTERKQAEDNGTDSDYATMAKIKAIVEENPQKAAEMIGLDYEKWTEHILQNNDPEAEKFKKVKDETKTEIQQLRDELAEKDKKTLDNQQEVEYNKYVNQLTEKLQTKEELTHINAMKAHQRVVNLIEQYVDKHGVGENNIKGESLEDIETKAARAVEKDLKREYEALQSKLNPTTSHSESNTITNTDKSIAPITRKEVDDLDFQERRKLAAKIIAEGFEDDDDEL